MTQRFEYSIELAWKTLKDYLEHQRVVLPQVTPRTVIREAFAARIIDDGQVWMDARNRMSHTCVMCKGDYESNSIQRAWVQIFLLLKRGRTNARACNIRQRRGKVLVGTGH